MIIDRLIETYPELLTADGFDAAIIGVAADFEEPRVIYSVSKVIKMLMEDGMSELDAIEHFEFNMAGAYVGKKHQYGAVMKWCWNLLLFRWPSKPLIFREGIFELIVLFTKHLYLVHIFA